MPLECQFNGCSKEILNTEKDTHETECQFREVECPICNMNQPLNKILNHGENDHKIDTTKYHNMNNLDFIWSLKEPNIMWRQISMKYRQTSI